MAQQRARYLGHDDFAGVDARLRLVSDAVVARTLADSIRLLIGERTHAAVAQTDVDKAGELDRAHQRLGRAPRRS